MLTLEGYLTACCSNMVFAIKGKVAANTFFEILESLENTMVGIRMVAK